MIPNFDEILLEVSYRVPQGIVDLTQDSHVNELINVLKENGVDNAEVFAQKARVYFSYLQEASILEKGKNPKTPIKAKGSAGGIKAKPSTSAMKPATQSKNKKPQTAAAAAAAALEKDRIAKGVKHLGKGYYGKSKGSPPTYKINKAKNGLDKLRPGEGPKYKGAGPEKKPAGKSGTDTGKKDTAVAGQQQAPPPKIGRAHV